MNLRRRLLLFGALVPSLVLGAGFVATGFLLRDHLFHALDRALLTQAAVESVSLFDLGEVPHLHLSRSPLTGHVRGFAPDAAIYDVGGRRFAAFPDGGIAPPRVRVEGVGADPVLRTIEVDGHKLRELRVIVRSPSGKRYLLWLGVGTAAIDRTMLFFGRAAGLVFLASALLFVLLARRESTSLHARLSRLALHMDRLREGRFEAPPPDDVADVVGALRESIAEATERLRIAHATEARLVADAAHELRTPLSAMRAVIDTTLRRERPAAELREALESARAEAERLSALVGEMLELASVQQTSFARRPASPEAIARAAVDGLRPIGEPRSVSFAVEVDSAPATFRVVESQVRRALENLLFNAIKVSPPGSTVRVVVSSHRDRVRFAVHDEGPGVAEEEREAIFEPFRRGKSGSDRGAGLGLAIVRDIARRHGGDAWVEGSGAAGSCFAFEIAPPAAAEGGRG